ncbi:MAG: MAC/perforin domain-containing protein [Spirochaetes bacterium]|jgi:hypothetical protein|nr:MAC/perforin domain-containing protein [Spirochaetota bacterium]
MYLLQSSSQKHVSYFFKFAICMLVCFIVSCESDTGETDKDKTKEITSDDIAIVIGHGYDITGRYAYSPEIKEAVLDFAKLSEAGLVKEDTNLAEGNFKSTSGSTITEYQKSLAISASASASVGVPGAGFSAEVGAHFNREKYENSQYSFATSTSKITKTSHFVEGRRDPSQLTDYVSAQFLKDLDLLSGEELINKYGTDVMLGGIWGARLDYHLSVKKKTESSGIDVGAYAEARASATFGVVEAGGGATASVDSTYSEYFETSSVETTTNAYGGSPEFAQSVHTEGNYDEWIKSIEANPIWCDYYPESLVPIYEFITDLEKKEEISQAYRLYLQDKEIIVKDTVSNITIQDNFYIKGGATKASSGDDEINSQSSGTTNWELEILLMKDGTNLKALIIYTVKEMQGDYTELVLTEDNHTIKVNREIVSIDSPTEYYTNGTVTGKYQSTKIIDVSDCEFLDFASIVIDGSGGDSDNISVYGTWNIDISVRDK